MQAHVIHEKDNCLVVNAQFHDWLFLKMTTNKYNAMSIWNGSTEIFLKKIKMKPKALT